MKKVFFMTLLAVLLLFSACGKEEIVPVTTPPGLTIVFPEGELTRNGQVGPWYYLNSDGEWRTMPAPSYALPERWWDQEADMTTAAETVQLLFEVPPAKVDVTRCRSEDGLERFTRLEDVGTMAIDEDRAVYHIVAEWEDEGRSWYGEAVYGLCIEKKD